MRMSVRAVLALAVVLGSGLLVPVAADGMSLQRVGSVSFATVIAGGPGSSVWTIGEHLERTDADGTVHEGWPTPIARWESRLASGPDGSAWLDVEGVAALDHAAVAGGVRTYALPINPWGSGVDDLDVAPSGTVWTTATVSTDKHSTRAKTYAMRIDPEGKVRVSPAVASEASDERPPTIAASDRGDVWMGVRCGRVKVRTRARDLTLSRVPHRCRAAAPGTPLALRHGPDGALWEVLADGRVRRTLAGRTTTLTRIGVGRHRVGLAFTGRGRHIRAWAQTARRVVEVPLHGSPVPHGLARALFPGEHSVNARGIAADHDGGLWLITGGGLQRVNLDRCPVRRVTGLAVDLAVRVLREAGCRTRVRPSMTRGPRAVRVIAQSTPAGQEVAAGATVTLTVARAPVHCAVNPRHETESVVSNRWSITSGIASYRTIVKACDRRTGKTWTVEDPYREDDGTIIYRPIELRGHWLTLLRSYDAGISHEGGAETTSLILADVAGHHHRTVTLFGSDWWADNEGNGGSDVFGNRFTDSSLNAHGDVAWLEDRAVRLLRQGAREPVTLDTDPAAAFAHLKIDGRRVSWTRDGVVRSALI